MRFPLNTNPKSRLVVGGWWLVVGGTFDGDELTSGKVKRDATQKEDASGGRLDDFFEPSQRNERAWFDPLFGFREGGCATERPHLDSRWEMGEVRSTAHKLVART
jgi:hypothetical protein